MLFPALLRHRKAWPHTWRHQPCLSFSSSLSVCQRPGITLNPLFVSIKLSHYQNFFKNGVSVTIGWFRELLFFLRVFSDFDLILSALFLYCRKLFFLESSIYELQPIPKHIVSIINHVKRFVWWSKTFKRYVTYNYFQQVVLVF